MSREEYEMSEEAYYEEFFPRGPGDPDAYGYPGESKATSQKILDREEQTENTIHGRVF